jgi:hypothetical protein
VVDAKQDASFLCCLGVCLVFTIPCCLSCVASRQGAMATSGHCFGTSARVLLLVYIVGVKLACFPHRGPGARRGQVVMASVPKVMVVVILWPPISGPGPPGVFPSITIIDALCDCRA